MSRRSALFYGGTEKRIARNMGKKRKMIEAKKPSVAAEERLPLVRSSEEPPKKKVLLEISVLSVNLGDNDSFNCPFLHYRPCFTWNTQRAHCTANQPDFNTI